MLSPDKTDEIRNAVFNSRVQRQKDSSSMDKSEEKSCLSLEKPDGESDDYHLEPFLAICAIRVTCIAQIYCKCTDFAV